MSFRYDVLNLDVLDRLRELFQKPSSEWTEKEYRSVAVALEVMRITMSKSKYAKK